MLVILASSSPRRRELLDQIGIEAIVEPADIDESMFPDESAEAYVERVARVKAERVAPGHGVDAIVVAADTAVVAAGEVMGKPVDADAAVRMLRALSGREHDVLTGVAVLNDGRLLSAVAKTRVRFAELTGVEIDAYVASGEPHDKAGAYGLQGAASMFVNALDGPVDNVIGLPRRLLATLVAELGHPIESLRTHRPRSSAE